MPRSFRNVVKWVSRCAMREAGNPQKFMETMAEGEIFTRSPARFSPRQIPSCSMDISVCSSTVSRKPLVSLQMPRFTLPWSERVLLRW